VIDANLLNPLVHLTNAEYSIKNEATWAIFNVVIRSSKEQIRFMVNEGCIKVLCDLLLCSNADIVSICLVGLEKILSAAESDKEHKEVIIQYIGMVDDCGGWDKIERLQTHPDIDIFEMSTMMLVKHWVSESDGFY